LKKAFVLDTNVLLRDGDAILKFQDNDVFIPLVVIEELDTFKNGMTTLSQNARKCIRTIDKLMKQGDLETGVKISPRKGFLFVQNGFHKMDGKKNDDIIIDYAVKIKKEKSSDYQDVILITKDLNMRIKANVLGISTEDYLNDRISEREEIIEEYFFDCPESIINEIYEKGEIDNIFEFPEHTYKVLRAKENPKHTVLIKTKLNRIQKLSEIDEIQGITPRNAEQRFLLDALLDDDIKVLFVLGIAGVGKTQLILAGGLEQLGKKFKKIYITRPTLPVAGNKHNEYGFLPGSLEEKIHPWFGAIYDNLENLIEVNYDELFNQKMIELGAIGFLRGRTLKNRFIFIDEAQGTTPMEIKTIISRAGENSKMVIAGDPYQIDNPFLNSFDNGLVYASEKLKGKKGVAVIHMYKCQRSYISELASEL